MNFMKDIRTTITTTEQINRIIDKYEAEQEEADDTEDLYGDAPTDEEWNDWFMNQSLLRQSAESASCS